MHFFRYQPHIIDDHRCVYIDSSTKEKLNTEQINIYIYTYHIYIWKVMEIVEKHEVSDEDLSKLAIPLLKVMSFLFL